MGWDKAQGAEQTARMARPCVCHSCQRAEDFERAKGVKAEHSDADNADLGDLLVLVSVRTSPSMQLHLCSDPGRCNNVL